MSIYRKKRSKAKRKKNKRNNIMSNRSNKKSMIVEKISQEAMTRTN
jgi:hypothetical protein